MCALYKRGKVWWFDFKFQGRRIQECTGMKNKIAAQEAETIRKAALLERRAGITRKPLPPKFEEYVPAFLKWSEQQHRWKTYDLHKTNCDTLLRFFTGKWLDEITQGMVEDFKLARIQRRAAQCSRRQYRCSGYRKPGAHDLAVTFQLCGPLWAGSSESG